MVTIVLAAGLGLLAMPGSERPAAFTVAKSCGFTDAEIERILQGDVLTKPLKEGSDRELAGVGAVWLATPLAEFAEMTLEGRLLETDASIRSLHVWRRDESAAEAFTELHVDAEQQRLLEGRYDSYRNTGLKGAGTPGGLLALAIKETELLARVPGYERALLGFPSDSLPGMDHRFFAYEQEVDGGRTLVLSHRSAVRDEDEALITEQRYFVSRIYDCRFTVSDGFDVRGGTFLIFVTRLFTDRVAGVGRTLKHALGRRRMLADVAAKLKLAREKSVRNIGGSSTPGGEGRRASAVSTDHERRQARMRARDPRVADVRSSEPRR